MLVGASERWLAKMRDIDELFLQGVDQVWPECRKHFDTSSYENPISDQLVALLKRSPIGRGRFLIDLRSKEPELDRNGKAFIRGELDIKVFFTLREDVFLIYECKRLNVTYPSGKRASLAGDYIEQGMMRFVTGQYARELPFGAMLGYVLDGDVDRASSAIRKAIGERLSPLGMTNAVPVSLNPIGIITHFSTVHDRLSFSKIEVRHALLPL